MGVKGAKIAAPPISFWQTRSPEPTGTDGGANSRGSTSISVSDHPQVGVSVSPQPEFGSSPGPARSGRVRVRKVKNRKKWILGIASVPLILTQNFLGVDPYAWGVCSEVFGRSGPRLRCWCPSLGTKLAGRPGSPGPAQPGPAGPKADFGGPKSSLGVSGAPRTPVDVFLGLKSRQESFAHIFRAICDV